MDDAISTAVPENKFTVFVSHPTEDNAIAKALQDALVDLDRLRVDIFVDQSEIPKGKSIGSYIRASLDRANWFIAIGADAVRSNFSWCGMELGYFTRVQQQRNDTSLTLIYHSQVHDLFAEQNNTQVVPLEPHHRSELPGELRQITDSPLYKLFMDIAQSYVDFYSHGVVNQAVSFREKFIDWASESTRAVTQTYYEALRQRVKEIWYPQNRLEIRIDDGDFWKSTTKTIPMESTLEFDIPTFGIFKLAVPAGPTRSPMTWQDFGTMVRRQCGSDALLKIVNEVLCSVLPMGSDAENDLSFVAPDRVRYRVLLVKHQCYGTNRRDFVINFVPTIKRDAGGDKATSQLTGAIMMASKYWFMFLENDSTYSPDAFARAAPTKALDSMVRKMLRDMDRVSLEASEDGLADKSVLGDLLGNADEVNEMSTAWWPTLDQLRRTADAVLNSREGARAEFLAALNEFVEVSKTVNRNFIRLCLDAYKTRLQLPSTSSST
jgi:hypothetical protein